MLHAYAYRIWRGSVKEGTFGGSVCLVLLTLILIGAATNRASAQSLNWEGQDGIFVTPLAYAVPSSDKNFGRPVVAYHYLQAGSVLGGFHQISVTMGAFNRIEFGYTRDQHQEGSTVGVSQLWSSGFNAFHAKVSLVSERRNWRPALSIGFVARAQVQNVGGVIQKQQTNNQDFYIVATKTVTQTKHVPLVFNLGFKTTNASLLGLAGNAPAYQGRLFGAAAFAVKGPGRGTILLGSEVLQQPRNIQGLPGAVIPTTLTYAVRYIPGGALPLHGWGVESPKLTIDFGVAQVANNIMPGVSLQARHQFALGVSYGF
jgi:Protein of unknown function (DUF3034)